MFQILHNVNLDWLKYRKVFILISTIIMLAGLASALFRHQFHPNGTEAFNLGIDFKGGTVVTADFKQRPAPEVIRDALHAEGVADPIIQPITDKPGQVLIRLPKMESGEAEAAGQTQVDIGRSTVAGALKKLTGGVQVEPNAEFPAEGNAFKIVGTDAVGAVAGAALRNQAVAVTLLALIGILLYIGFRFEWTYGAAAVIAVFHDVLVTLGFFSIFQFEVNLTVIAALLTLVGFSVNDTIVIFDRIRENLRMHRRSTLYDVTNDSINQTLSRTIITSGLVFLSVLAMVLFGGEVLRGFSVALLIGIIFGTYSSVAIASPIMVWWQQRLEAGREQDSATGTRGGGTGARNQRQSPDARNTRASAAAR
ncbi:MAG: protein translocase subunit SecF [Pyrinomonadaceae bacterium]